MQNDLEIAKNTNLLEQGTLSGFSLFNDVFDLVARVVLSGYKLKLPLSFFFFISLT